MNELRTLEQMEGVAEPASPTSWAEARERIKELREDQNLGSDSLYSLRIRTTVPFHNDPRSHERGPWVERSDPLDPPQSSSMTYAGIGSRRTPGPALNAMRATAERLATLGYTMRSGHAPGADTAFEVASQKLRDLPAMAQLREQPAARRQLHPTSRDRCGDATRVAHPSRLGAARSGATRTARTQHAPDSRT